MIQRGFGDLDIAKIPPILKMFPAQISGETDTLYLLFSNPLCSSHEQSDINYRIFSNYKKIFLSQRLGFCQFDRTCLNFLALHWNTTPQTSGTLYLSLRTQRTLVYTQALFSIFKDISHNDISISDTGTAPKKNSYHSTRQLFLTIVNKQYIMSPKCTLELPSNCGEKQVLEVKIFSHHPTVFSNSLKLQ